ncbi:hypothetical protein [Methylobacterium soli]|uniref:Uncharacterized protein n=1 Tax=Methylobacterium soli TaxID=553447 RepID=A0A6L3SZB2_9HYPH|nr:hypothetical protein [Methylobacterium soli]KAB1078695.1 hypothetical protein F6X53_13465 [Methylobacterium soli]GJE43327.1 hypothetical protein AEGHOMDF_2506 [Methylobacterium soli]
MAELARRVRDGSGSDVVRRLIARPIRIDFTRPSAPAPDFEAEALEDEAEPEAADLARLRAEMLVMKAVLQAERQESAALRAQVHDIAAADEALTPESRAVRDRWAALVDTLLHAPR